METVEVEGYRLIQVTMREFAIVYDRRAKKEVYRDTVMFRLNYSDTRFKGSLKDCIEYLNTRLNRVKEKNDGTRN